MADSANQQVCKKNGGNDSHKYHCKSRYGQNCGVLHMLFLDLMFTYILYHLQMCFEELKDLNAVKCTV